ncbi:glucose-6-phosphate dehydrogenase assembly protein OpcA [Sediminivirga luteola]|uniref:Glucose-6-phosphate dehydrogenase assembly protein OpcA n=1 Tax=Sediminivirga luteola TaxID=1774748 RepID=A0A8J2XM61_9MICO|nr:glucose-6-phosphate dehydrogenase assembly protein OpcA [Sediminivirga luteola]MCI2264093.1 glucose-6-phosphate dehydrogenase assembly protein OpcA [Sediminivirga luteola]GGA28360.1 glucose-6-phosphate dehydrogenase assembly protein OpcA [Sediminivirga luteola]
MIVDLHDTGTAEIAEELVRLRDVGGVVALGRVLTLIVTVEGPRADAEQVIAQANAASSDNPCRVIVIGSAGPDAHERPTRLDAQLRVGGDAGASEVIILSCHGELTSSHLHDGLVAAFLLPDAPVVAWWPFDAPADVASSPVGRIAQRRITDIQHSGRTGTRVAEQIQVLEDFYQPGDTDMSWARLTNWRQQLAATLDLPPYAPVTAATVHGDPSSVGARLMQRWLRLCLGCSVRFERIDPAKADDCGLLRVELHREAAGTTTLERVSDSLAVLRQPGLRERQVSLPTPSGTERLTAELRLIDSDDFYGRVLKG